MTGITKAAVAILIRPPEDMGMAKSLVFFQRRATNRNSNRTTRRRKKTNNGALVALQTQVSSARFDNLKPFLLKYFVNKCENFEARNTRNYLHTWKQITSDNELIQTAKGLHLEFASPPQQHFINYPTLSPHECSAMNDGRFKN